MARPIGVLRFLNILFAAIGAGTLVAMLVGLIPVVRNLPAGEGLALRRALEERIDRYQPVCIVLSAATALAILFLERGSWSSSRVATAVGLAGSLTVGLTSVAWNNRIDERMAPRSQHTLSEDYATLRAQWEGGHLVRTLASVLALSGYIVAALLDRRTGGAS